MGHWTQTRDGDPVARWLFDRHYSRIHHKNPSKLFVGPGEKLVLVTRNYDAIFVWRNFIDDSGQSGINCAVFRNESNVLSSELILEAEEWAKKRWPNEMRYYTFVDETKIHSSNPGFCFLSAGWNKCGRTKKRNLVILEKEAHNDE